MGWLDPFNVFDPGKGYRAAGKEIKKGYQEGQGYLNPYNQAGTDQLQKLLAAQGNLLDPSKLQSEWAKGYETSPYAKQLQDQAKAGGMDAASSQGLLGSSTAINSIQQGSSNIMQADRQKYMDDLMQKYLSGIGIGQNIYGTGANAAGQMSGNAMDFGKQMGSMQFGKTNAPMDMLMNMFKMYAASQGGGA
jgi:hypothetical protein